MKLQNQIAVVAGGASGLGKACVEALEQHNIRVVVWDKTSLENAIECDVSSASAVEEAMRETIRCYGAPRIGINCAGIAPSKRMVSKEGAMPLADFQLCMDRK